MTWRPSLFSPSKIGVEQVCYIVFLFILLKFVDGICMPSIAECSSENDVVIGFKKHSWPFWPSV